MTQLNTELPANMDCAGDAEPSEESIIVQLTALKDQLSDLTNAASAVDRANLLLDISSLQHQVGESEEAWQNGHDAFKVFLENEQWEQAAQACEVIFKAEMDDALPALGQGIWLSVTYPIDPQVSVAMLEYVVDETPHDSDGAAVAATTAYFLADMRSEGKKREDLTLYAGNLLANVARRHSNIEGQDAFDLWMERLELKDPDKFLIRLRNVIDVLVQEDWWFDREALQEQLPES